MEILVLFILRFFFLSLMQRLCLYEGNHWRNKGLQGVKGTRCLGSGELVRAKHLKPFVIKCIWLERCFKSIDPHQYASKLHGFLIRRELTRHTILWSQVFDSINWRPCEFAKYKENHALSRHVCVDHYILLSKNLYNQYLFHKNKNKRFQLLFMDKLARSEVTCSFNVISFDLILSIPDPSHQSPERFCVPSSNYFSMKRKDAL